MKEVDSLIYSLGKGAMRIWARILLRVIHAQGLDIEQARRRAESYSKSDDYFSIGEVNPLAYT